MASAGIAVATMAYHGYKAVVEGSVRFVAGQVAAILRNRQFIGLAELNEAIFDEVAAIKGLSS